MALLSLERERSVASLHTNTQQHILIFGPIIVELSTSLTAILPRCRESTLTKFKHADLSKLAT